MNKCSPVEMRKNLEIVEAFKSYGIDFVCIPVTEEDKVKFLSLMQERLDAIADNIESE